MLIWPQNISPPKYVLIIEGKAVLRGICQTPSSPCDQKLTSSVISHSDIIVAYVMCALHLVILFKNPQPPSNREKPSDTSRWLKVCGDKCLTSTPQKCQGCESQGKRPSSHHRWEETTETRQLHAHGALEQKRLPTKKPVRLIRLPWYHCWFLGFDSRTMFMSGCNIRGSWVKGIWELFYLYNFWKSKNIF